MSMFDILNKSLTPELGARLNRSRKLYPGQPQKVFDHFLEAGSVPSTAVANINFARKVLEYTVDQSALCAGILGLLKSLDNETLANFLFPRARLDTLLAQRPGSFPKALTREKLDDVRSNFLDDKALVVMLVLVRAGKFAINEKDRVTADRVLTTIIQKDLELDPTVVLNTLKNAKFPGLSSVEPPSLPTDDDVRHSLDFIKSIKGLSTIVNDAEDVPSLWNSNYRSIRWITLKPKNTFTEEMVTLGMSSEVALKIHDSAQRIDCWNEQLWLALMEARTKDSIPLQPIQGQVTTQKNTSNTIQHQEGPTAKSLYNLTDIFRLEDAACEECCSVTSLSAYFADLMLLLSTTSPKGAELPPRVEVAGNEVLSSHQKKLRLQSRDSLLTLLSKRRPDLRKLELTCANSQTLIPYIQLVNEVLESFIRHKNTASALEDKDKPPLIKAFNTPINTGDEDDESLEPVYRPANMDYEVYSDYISKQMFPFTCFPYNQARDVVNQYCSTFQLELSDLSEAFSFRELLLNLVSADDIQGLSQDLRDCLLRGAEEVLQRQWAADILGIQKVEFAAISGETFFPVYFADQLRGLSNGSITIDTRYPEADMCRLWGYKDDDTMTDATNELGLTYIKRQLMQRSGLEFQDISDLVKTQFFGQQVTITNATGSQTFTGSLEELRLVAQIYPSGQEADDPNDEDEEEFEPLTGPLTPEICYSLQAFLRLQAKVKWSTRDLDAAIFCLRNKEIQNSSTFKMPAAPVETDISPYVIKGIAHVVRLSKLCGIDAPSLLPLWGPIDSFGPKSLLRRKFLRPSLSEPFDASTNGGYFLNGTKRIQIQSCGPSICARLSWPYELFGDLLQVTELALAALDIESFSKLYRHVLLLRILKIPAKLCIPFFDVVLSKGMGSPFNSPRDALLLLEKWKLLLDNGWDAETLIKTLGSTNAGEDNASAGNNFGFQLASAMAVGSKELQKSLSSLYTTGISTAEDVIECAGRAFDASTATSVVDFVEGTQVSTGTISIAKEDFERLILISAKWPTRLSIGPTRIESGTYRAELRLLGVLTTLEKKQLQEDVKELPAVAEKILSMLKKSINAREIIKSRFRDTPQDSILLQDWPPSQVLDKDPTSSEGEKATALQPETKVKASTSPTQARLEEQKLIEAEAQVRKRRDAFVQLAKPTIIHDLLTTLITDTIKGLFPEADTEIIRLLLTTIVKFSRQGESSSTTNSAMEALQYLSDGAKEAGSTTLDAYFTPSVASNFTFRLAETGGRKLPEPPRLVVDGMLIIFNSDTRSWSPIYMAKGQPYRLESNHTASEFLWSTAESTEAEITEDMLLHRTVTSRAAAIYDGISRVVGICQRLKLGTDDLTYMAVAQLSQGKFLNANLNTITLQELVDLQKYVKLRDQSRGVPGKSLVGLFSWLSGTKEADAKTIAAQITECTGWKTTLIESILSYKYSGYSHTELMDTLRNFDAILALQSIVAFDQRLGGTPEASSKALIEDLFILGQPSRQFAVTAEYVTAARAMQTRLSSSQRATADEGLMENQRTALVNYLLQQDYIKDMGIWHADGLFERFLIDVQMGPQLRTSRIKQAISVVQLFAQRCILGLEEGVSKTALRQEKWAWMQQYTMWEAHRKMFLYPENWIDPTLRDDKSALFNDLESSLMQKNLSVSTFLQAVQSYVHGLNEISSLEIVSYLHEPQSKDVDVFHFFGRTRIAPHVFYYRTLTIYRGSNDIFWRAWTKIDMDIPSIETEWEGNRLRNTGTYLLPIVIGGRLYLFMPSIVPKTIANAQDAGVTLGPGAHAEGPGALSDRPEPVSLYIDQAQVAAPKPKRIWEITMGWTEFVAGSWSPKRMSQGSCDVEITNASATQFRMDPKFSGSKLDKLNIIISSAPDVDGAAAGATRSGTFEFCQDQMVFRDETTDVGTSNSNKLPMLFQKVVGSNFEPAQLIEGEKYANDQVLLWVPKDLASKTTKDNITWTLSKSTTRVTGLVLSAEQTDGTSISYFNLPRQPLVRPNNVEWDAKSLANDMELILLDHTFSHELMEATADRIDPLRSLYNYLARLPVQNHRGSFGAGSGDVWYHELGHPTALYNWEIGLHAILLAVDRFFSTQQFEEALQVARLVFDPSADLVVEIQDDAGQPQSVTTCWRFPPFQDMARKMARDGEASSDLSLLRKEVELAVKERRSYGSLVHAAARGRPASYMKWIVMKYAEILIASGDIHFRRGTLESLPLAIQRYTEASHVLGPEPPKVPDLAKRKRKAMTFEQLREEDIVNDLIKLQLPPLFSAMMQKKKTKGAVEKGERDPKGENIACFLRTGYFGVPINPRFKQMRNLVRGRLFNIRNSLDIQGRPIVYALREPPIDPAEMMALSSAGISMMDVMSDSSTPIPRQRFEFLLGKALELCSELRSLGDRLLSAIEKKESETFAALKARHTTTIQQMMLDIKKVQLEESQQTVDSLMLNRGSLETQLSYYLRLIGEPLSKVPKPTEDWSDIQQDIDDPTEDDLKMSPHEESEMDLATASTVLNVIAAGMDGFIAPLCAVPQVEGLAAPFGCGVSTSFGGSQLASAVAAGSAAVKMAAMVTADRGTNAGRKAQLTRQLQERRLQANMRGRDIKSIDKQIEIQRIRVMAARKEIDLQKSEFEDAQQTEAWYRSKYTNENLYAWMEKSLRGTYFQAYTLAIAMAQRAESALSFDEGRKLSIIRPAGYWDGSHDGLLAADSLYLDLKRLETAQLNSASADFAISKTISLRQIDPMALMRLRITGVADFSIDELLYDVDFPGHYMRRIKSVAVSVPAIVGPHTGVNAILTLLQHRYRTSQNVADAADYISSQTDGESFRTDRIPISTIAISSGSGDSGVFELNFNGPTYMPFEGAGAVSSWRLEFPAAIRKFDYESISDVLLHVQYTAHQGGALLKAAASEAVRQAAETADRRGKQDGFWAIWDLKNDFSNEWYGFRSRLGAKPGAAGEIAASMNLGDLKGRLPFWSRQRSSLQVHSTMLLSKSQALIQALDIDKIPTPPKDSKERKWDDGSLGDYFTRSSSARIDALDWAVQAANVIETKSIDNVYLLVQYSFLDN
ncbi:hypothetical protein JX266_013151 [Neoarthrinium moseri]|nr:hypothetical protein JX266_013151 [Neoarthrinium moseri]